MEKYPSTSSKNEKNDKNDKNEFPILPDPLNDREIKDVNPPPHQDMPVKLLFPNSKTPEIPDWKTLKSYLTKEGKISKKDLLSLLSKFTSIVKKENNILKIQDPVTIVGDIHGQYYDLLKILEVGGNPEQTKYIFLGDYVDRGSFSIEVWVLLIALKINFPESIIMLRGNHESRQMTSFFNFLTECKLKYDEEVYEKIMTAFDSLPLGAIINDKFFAVHGGISPYLNKLSEIYSVSRFIETPKDGALCDFLWSDPIEDDNEALVCEWEENSNRGCSFNFGAKALLPYLSGNNLVSVIRAHEAQLEGFKMYKWNKKIDFPSCVTVFSAANYCDVYGNKGAIIKFKNNQFNLVQFNCSPHPFLLPDFQNLFTWSLPFISEKSKLN